jgi:hypothetical protein
VGGREKQQCHVGNATVREYLRAFANMHGG